MSHTSPKVHPGRLGGRGGEGREGGEGEVMLPFSGQHCTVLQRKQQDPTGGPIVYNIVHGAMVDAT